jgi:hypothetical protein
MTRKYCIFAALLIAVSALPCFIENLRVAVETVGSSTAVLD